MGRYFIAALAFIGLAVLLIILLFSGHGGSKTAPPKPLDLVSYANTNAEVELIVDGPIVAPQNHNSAVTIVNQNSITFNLVQGYNGNIVASKVYNNSQNSYRNFLYAIYYAGFTSQIKSTYASDIGLCSTGDRYDFYLINNGQTLFHSWTTNCSGSGRTFNGSLALMQGLFQGQVPDLETLTENSNL
jgi:hypothetical protein